MWGAKRGEKHNDIETGQNISPFFFYSSTNESEKGIILCRFDIIQCRFF